jgi:Tfp pilus assembly PilM family ATPase
MKRKSTLPLGIDVGARRVRIAQSERTSAGAIRLIGVAVRDLPGDLIYPERIAEPDLIAAVIEDLAREIDPRARRCVIALPAPVARLRLIRFPSMSSSERRRAARFEAERFAGWDVKSIGSIVRVHPADAAAGVHAVGIAREDAVAGRVGCMKKARLRIAGIDHDACAMRRAFPFTDAVLDVGLHRTSLHAFSALGPISLTIALGGHSITQAIAADLAIDAMAAEKRKHILGTAGAGEAARDAFAASVAAAVEKARTQSSIRSIALVGNGSRLPGLNAAIQNATGAHVDLPVSDVLRGGAYPDDVIAAAAADWTLAASLSAWAAAV